jgi:hypothetical protein
VGQRAWEVYPSGKLVDASHRDHLAAIKQTKEFIEAGALTIYEATFEHEGIQCKVDILHRDQVGKPWKLIEVKSTTQVKDQHIPDAAVQTWVLEGSGVKCQQVILMHLNRKCRAPDLSYLFEQEDITPLVREFIARLEKDIAGFKSLLSEKTEPKIDIGPHCQSPYECPFQAHCWSHIPENSVFDLPGKSWPLYERGVIRLEDVNPDELETKQRRAVEVFRSRQRFIDKKAISEAMKGWKYPLAYLDFETIAPAIPRYDDTGPYENVPFQYSLHIQTHMGAEPTHHEYLHPDHSDPRETLTKQMLADLPQTGSIVSYNKAFEAGVIRDLAEHLPHLSSALLALCDRMVDPLPILRASVYDSGFKGSFSIKSVAPALLGAEASYDGLAVPDAQAAQRAYEEMIHPETLSARHQEIRQALLAYCGQDSLLMVRLVEWLLKQ